MLLLSIGLSVLDKKQWLEDRKKWQTTRWNYQATSRIWGKSSWNGQKSRWHGCWHESFASTDDQQTKPLELYLCTILCFCQFLRFSWILCFWYFALHLTILTFGYFMLIVFMFLIFWLILDTLGYPEHFELMLSFYPISFLILEFFLLKTKGGVRHIKYLGSYSN